MYPTHTSSNPFLASDPWSNEPGREGLLRDTSQFFEAMRASLPSTPYNGPPPHVTGVPIAQRHQPYEQPSPTEQQQHHASHVAGLQPHPSPRMARRSPTRSRRPMLPLTGIRMLHPSCRRRITSPVRRVLLSCLPASPSIRGSLTRRPFLLAHTQPHLRPRTTSSLPPRRSSYLRQVLSRRSMPSRRRRGRTKTSCRSSATTGARSLYASRTSSE